MHQNLKHDRLLREKFGGFCLVRPTSRKLELGNIAIVTFVFIERNHSRLEFFLDRR